MVGAVTSPLDHKLCTAVQAAAMIENDKTLVSGGFIGAAVPEALLTAIEKRFLDTGSPRNLTVVYGAGQGDGQTRGINHLGHEGLIKRVIGGHFGLIPRIGKLALDNKIEAYNFPQGVICQLIRDIAAKRPGCITHIGLDTFIDPVHHGGCINDRTPPGAVERVTLGGKTWLWYKAFPIHVGLIRATVADPLGNLSMHEEAITGEALPIAQAAHNHGGIVIAQVQRVQDQPLAPHQVNVPGVLVDHIVIADPEHHPQTFGDTFNQSFFTPAKSAAIEVPSMDPMPLDQRRIIAARALDEIPEGAIVNLGIGMPEGIARVAAERGLLNHFTLTVESGPIGGMPAGGLSFGASVHPHAIIDQPAMFDFYDGQGLDYAALGAAQIDAQGNVNVSRFGSRLAGVGGFVNITQTAKRLVFCGTFTASGLKVAINDGSLQIAHEGKVQKFIPQLEQVSFSASQCLDSQRQVLYITERAVFKLTNQGLQLIELAPGIDLQNDILRHMAFKPIIEDFKLMPAHLFKA